MPYKIKYSNELKHHGILGMKWGVWNDETAARYRGSSKWHTQSIKKGKDKSNVSPAQEVSKNTENIVRSFSRIAKRKEDRDKKKLPKKTDSMTDKELRDTVNRLRLEQEYDTLTKNDVDDGKITVSEILDTAGDVLAIAGSLATIVSVINTLNKTV